MDAVYMILGWGSPIGTGIFLVCFSLMILLLSLAGKNADKGKK